MVIQMRPPRGGMSGRTLDKIAVPANTPPERAYRWRWSKRTTSGSQHDFQNVYALVDAFNLTDSQGYTSRVAALVDVDQWMRTLAVERFVGNWDSFGYAYDKNMYFYKLESARFMRLGRIRSGRDWGTFRGRAWRRGIS